ncbi:cell wall metabolism sensor histidine kinase WalK [uncultured Treponema sp.]|uniref:sensor histidine kinase n=1 Tax=uncultured Treponema sp. TaxID=162155 RepID=UPI0025D83DEB|nr:HAMP domain-containing sensor histidine kinase [uncultured Treponema sp.]
MKSIFARILTGFIAASFAVIAAMSVIFTVSVSRSINDWNTDKKDDFVALILPAISKTYRLTGSLSASELEKAVMPYTTDSLYIYIFDGNKKPVLLLEKGKVSTQGDVEKSVGSLSTFLSLNSPVQIKDGDDTIGYLCADNVGFLAYKANRIFVSTMEKGLFAGIVLAVSITIALSVLISTMLSKKARTLADYISSPDLMKTELGALGVNEFDRILDSVKKLKNRLLHEETLRRQWMQDISHDLRTPLTAVKMQVEGMNDGVLEATAERFAALYSELTLIEKLVWNLQDLSRFESPEMKISAVKVNAFKFTDDVALRFSLLAEKKKIKFSVQKKCAEDFDFTADPLLLMRCVSNLLQNAFQYTAEDGEVTLCTEETPESRVKISVMNTGAISEDDIPHVFDRLYRGDRSRSTAGSGLGLSIAQAIANLHGGKIEVQNEKDEKGEACVCFSVVV